MAWSKTFDEGTRAWRSRKGLDANPYEHESREWKSWREGWISQSLK